MTATDILQDLVKVIKEYIDAQMDYNDEIEDLIKLVKEDIGSLNHQVSTLQKQIYEIKNECPYAQWIDSDDD